MQYFFDTVETIPAGVGFSYFGPLHLTWIALGVLFSVLSCRVYKRASSDRRRTMRCTYAVLIILNECFKTVCLLIGGTWDPKYLPLHLCSINIFLIAWHAVRPNRMLDNFLYAVCIPGAAAALLFSSWSALPLCNFMHLHSFTIHILLLAYPVMLTYAGEIRPEPRMLPRSIGLLLLMAIPIHIVNLTLDTNFMYLVYPEPGNPLLWFEERFGNHLIGLPFLLFAVCLIMYLPVLFLRKKRSK
ncbi:MAG: YwaF family protein [Butyricicoccus sp.]|nr:YwaF family protein [Butyricicoccus sp.]